MSAAVEVRCKPLGMPNNKSGPGGALVGDFETNAHPSGYEVAGRTDRNKPL